MSLFSKRLTPNSEVAHHLLSWQGDTSPTGASVHLRLASALHALVLEGKNGALSDLYPPREVDDETLWSAIQDAFERDRDFILNWLKSPPQTNEIRRSAILIASCHLLSDRFSMPIVLSELGASAGLNLLIDRMALQIGDTCFAPEAPILTLRPEWSGPLPPLAPYHIQERAGTDINPLDPQRSDHLLRLMAYTWPDQPERLERLRLLAPNQKTQIANKWASHWLQKRLDHRYENALHLVYHTIAWQYFPHDEQEAAQKALSRAGQRATDKAPLARLSMEADGNTPSASLDLTLWPRGEKYHLGRVDFHGRWVNWFGNVNPK